MCDFCNFEKYKQYEKPMDVMLDYLKGNLSYEEIGVAINCVFTECIYEKMVKELDNEGNRM